MSPFRKNSLFFRSFLIILTFIRDQTSYGQGFNFWLLGNYSADSSVVEESLRVDDYFEYKVDETIDKEDQSQVILGLDYCQGAGFCFGFRFFQDSSRSSRTLTTEGIDGYQASIKVELLERMIGPSVGFRLDPFYFGMTLIAGYQFKLRYEFEADSDNVVSTIPTGEINRSIGGEIYQMSFGVGDVLKLVASIQYQNLYIDHSVKEVVFDQQYETITSSQVNRIRPYIGCVLYLD